MNYLSDLPLVFMKSNQAAFDLQVCDFQMHIIFASDSDNKPDVMKNIEEILQKSYTL